MLSPPCDGSRWWVLLKAAWLLHYLSRPHRARGALLSLSSSTEASLHTFCETSHPQCLWLRELFITEEWDRVARELATCLTHFSVGVIAFPVSLLFHFGKMPKPSQLNPGRRRFAVHSLYVLLSFSSTPTTSPVGSGWSAMRGQEGSRQIPSQLTASCIQKPLCSQDVFQSAVVSG